MKKNISLFLYLLHPINQVGGRMVFLSTRLINNNPCIANNKNLVYMKPPSIVYQTSRRNYFVLGVCTTTTITIEIQLYIWTHPNTNPRAIVSLVSNTIEKYN